MMGRIEGSRGFTLVELMVALAIGLIISLAAGQLFLNGLRNFQKIEELSDRQAALTFVSDVLLNDIRRADLSSGCGSGETLAFWVDGVCHVYTLANGTLRLSVNGDTQPMVNGVVALERLVEGAAGCAMVGYYCLVMRLEGEARPIRWHVMNRTLAVTDS